MARETDPRQHQARPEPVRIAKPPKRWSDMTPDEKLAFATEIHSAFVEASGRKEQRAKTDRLGSGGTDREVRPRESRGA